MEVRRCRLQPGPRRCLHAAGWRRERDNRPGIGDLRLWAAAARLPHTGITRP